MELKPRKKTYRGSCMSRPETKNYIISDCKKEDTKGGATPFQRYWCPDL